MDKNIAKEIKLPSVPKQVSNCLTMEEVKEMIDSFGYKTYFEARNKAIIAMFAETGIRSTELRTLKNSDVNVKKGIIQIDGKGNRGRFVSISMNLYNVLLKYEQIRKHHFEHAIIPNVFFLSNRGLGISHVGLDKIVKEAREERYMGNL